MSNQAISHKNKLREIYVDSTPRQRLKVALDRLSFPDHEPNLLITRVSSVEALARSLLVHHVASRGEPISIVYERYRLINPEKLLENYLSATVKKSPCEYFGNECWKSFQDAVQYRHLLVHECTYIDPAVARPLIDSCRNILLEIAKLAQLPTEHI